MLTLHSQRQHQSPVNFPYYQFASVAGGFVLSFAANPLVMPRSDSIR